MQKVILHNEEEFVEMFQVEELEERLENKWELSASGGANSTGPHVEATAKLTI